MIRATALRRLVFTLAAALGPAACGLNQEGVAPPNNTFFYPATAILDASASWLYVANSNADLRYNDGTLVMVNVGASVAVPDPNDNTKVIIRQGAADDRAAGASWGPCPMGDYVNTPRPTTSDAHYCCWDRIDVNILNCDERAYIPGDSSVRIGSFAAGMALQRRTCPNLNSPTGNPADCSCEDPTDVPPDRLFISVRGDTSLTFVNTSRVDTSTPQTAQPTFYCLGDASELTSGAFAVCSDAHRFTGSTPGIATLSPGANPPSIPLPNEPYALAIDPGAGLLFVGHLTGDTSHSYTGGYSLFDIAPTGSESTLAAPRFIAPFPSPFPANAGGLMGITTLSNAGTNPAEPGVVFATSRYIPEVVGLTTIADCPVQGTRDVVAAPNGDLYGTSLVGSETRGIAFTTVNTAAGAITRPFVLQRTPPALVGFDGTLPVSVLETCSSPTFLYKSAADAAIGDRLYVNCYDTGEVYVFDPSVPRLEATFQVGRGPAGMVFPQGETATIAYVVGFGDNNVSVVDLRPGSPTEYHVIQRIGFPSEVPR